MLLYEIQDRISQRLRRTLRELFFSWITCSLLVAFLFNSTDWLMCVIAGSLATLPIFLLYKALRFATDPRSLPSRR
jgi:hypothetical protein